MSDPGADHQFQPQPTHVLPSLSSTEATDLSKIADAPPSHKKMLGFLPPGLLFGAGAGLILGAFFAAVCCWLISLDDFLGQGALIGAAVGAFGGAVIAFLERKIRGELLRPDSATFIGAVFGLPPALLTFAGVGGVPRGFSLLSLVGMIFIGPMIGILIGALLDRAYEAGRKNSWRAALAPGAAGVALCLAILFILDLTSRGPDPEEIASKVEPLIMEEWLKTPGIRKPRIQKITLGRKGRKAYSGVMKATIDGRAERFSLTVTIEADESMQLEWKPLKEEPENP